MASSDSQRRCVFVGNIPYDATEEQLMQICEEVGPVVSFRLVIDRETGRPKGYGFCEYKDEETALSARRNLQGYEINGRQLRVDFAENDKNTERNREQGRGGPGMATKIDSQKHTGGSAAAGEANINQPMGMSIATAAATLMEGVLEAAHSSSLLDLNGLQSRPVGIDSLTVQLARMSRSQLAEIISEMKVLASQNKEQARQLLLTMPILSKALFQAQVMLGMVTPQMLQMPTVGKISVSPLQSSLHDGQQGQQLSLQTLPGLPPLPKHTALPLLHTQPQPVVQNHDLKQGLLPSQSGVQTHSSIHPQVKPSPLQHTRQVVHPNLLSNNLLLAERTTVQTSVPPSTQLLERRVEPNSSSSLIIRDNTHKDTRGPQVQNDSARLTKRTLCSGVPETLCSRAINDVPDPTRRPSKWPRLSDGSNFPSADKNSPASVIGSSQFVGISEHQTSKIHPSNIDTHVTQTQLPPEVESALLQQMLNLTPEQLSSLPPDQQQQVMQLQKMLRQPT